MTDYIRFRISSQQIRRLVIEDFLTMYMSCHTSAVRAYSCSAMADEPHLCSGVSRLSSLVSRLVSAAHCFVVPIEKTVVVTISHISGCLTDPTNNCEVSENYVTDYILAAHLSDDQHPCSCRFILTHGVPLSIYSQDDSCRTERGRTQQPL